MPLPRELTDLPYAPYLEPFTGRIIPGAVHDGAHVDAATIEDVNAGTSRFLETAFSAVTFTRGSMRGARFNDVWLRAVRWAGTSLVETDWVDAELISTAIVGVEMHSSILRQVTFHGCKLDSVNLRGATITDVRFTDCQLRDVDLAGASLTNVSFPGSRLGPIRFAKAQMTNVDLTQATALEIDDGIDALRGATITQTQLYELAPWFAHSAGVTVQT
ncbi:MAG: pentapeptide repeat-containing protein [Actinobacteria bacterium]|nr:pentapeptide repeat-containing protein [Actinomycetota bacterium]MBI3688286.1 pentapeptide repeat-containing protein [Actinomycetota bacterium]